MSTVHTSNDGDLVLFNRGDSPKLYYRLRRPDGERWTQRSTRCSQTDAALKRARERHGELRFRARLGLSADPEAFALVVGRYLEELRREVALGLRPARHLRDYQPVVECYLKPFFGRMLIDEIDNTTIEAHRRWRDVPTRPMRWGNLRSKTDRRCAKSHSQDGDPGRCCLGEPHREVRLAGRAATEWPYKMEMSDA